ncbi:uncharacterized protein N7482_008018 [Penicillium canariense]|uniref:Uncharacterized protein n=1 Tax=Penicillium canariense TaxID=189055 RepID=A0A9W9HUH3_9EURO|nr:uncharacterized protein N7482_008018 [Penicillium canariense]KAJ5156918.1 hypothetical protein N7482_008018 [Penicillium canariense]
MRSVLQDQKTALITGAAPGLRSSAAAKACTWALLDIDQENLATVTTEVFVIRVADTEIWKATDQQITELLPSIDLVVFHAGNRIYAPGIGDWPCIHKPWCDGDYWHQRDALPSGRGARSSYGMQTDSFTLALNELSRSRH